tara:strand:+ start:17215 stop:17967 length:753 start_codon:yes stop_codon:yes gene_type:complete
MAIISGPQRWWIDSNPTFAAKQAVVQDNLLLNLDAGVSSSLSNGGFGTTWFNLTTGNNAIKYGPTYSSSVGNGSFLFDGYNDRFECGNITGFYANNSLTLEAWVRLTSMTGDDGDSSFIIQGGGSSLRFDFKTSGNYIQFRLGGAASGTIDTSSTVSLNTWYHLVGTWDGSNVNFYLNNSLQGTKTRSYTLPDSIVTDFGRYRMTTQNPIPSEDASQFNGYLSTVRIYNKALTATEVSQNFNVYKGRFGL